MRTSLPGGSRGVFAGIVEIALVGYLLARGMGAVRRRLLRWHEEMQEKIII
jgi:ABC-type nitrate/sulfonate/bicarbonate transport system permease component